MKKKNGYTVVDLVIIIAVFGFITFLTINRVSYALSDDKSEVYNLEIKLIETQAKAYGKDKIDEIKEKDQIITVNTLVNEKYLTADDEEGKVYDPRDEKKTLNTNKIKLTYDKNKDEVVAKFQK